MRPGTWIALALSGTVAALVLSQRRDDAPASPSKPNGKPPPVGGGTPPPNGGTPPPGGGTAGLPDVRPGDDVVATYVPPTVSIPAGSRPVSVAATVEMLDNPDLVVGQIKRVSYRVTVDGREYLQTEALIPNVPVRDLPLASVRAVTRGGMPVLVSPEPLEDTF